MSKFKVGDKIRVKKDANSIKSDSHIYFTDSMHCFLGREGKISGVWDCNYCIDIDSDRFYWSEKWLELIESNNKVTNMNIIQKFALALKAEPQKSYQKAGITDSSDMLTEDGTKIFLTYLLNKDTDFKTQVVDELLKEVKEQ